MAINKRIQLLTILFFTVSFLDVLGVFLHHDLMQHIFKPMIILSLMALYYTSVTTKNYWYLLALAFSFLGDVLLLDKNNLFLFGIAAFLLTQLLYIKIIGKQIKEASFQQKLVAIIPFVIYLVTLLFILYDNLNEFLIPVIIYGAAISVFGMVALLNYVVDSSKINRVLLIGATLFIASDSMIALNKFYEEKSFYGVAIMMTYVLAQYLIYLFMKEELEVGSRN
jgi:uncharacterized membrane protein YhhN